MNKKMVIGIGSIVLIALIGFLVIKGISKEPEKNTLSSHQEEENNMYKTGKHHTKIEIKNYGTIELELDADVAPITVANFAKLVNEGFYDGLTFHRIIAGFMIQGGDPEGNGMGGSSENIKGEFSLNGVENTISHVRGTISMARSSAYNSASSQFFIVHEDSIFLDGQYAGFGKVTSGIEIVDKICEDTQVEDDNGTVLEKNQPIIEKIQMVD
ncbi:MAG: peptidylprolyl isomerase [Clostridia bacterium]|nr:peptidylprolyl isomerase [Clostridia bacterium]